MKDNIDDRVRELEAQDVFKLTYGSGNPNGVKVSHPGAFLMDISAQKLYVCFGSSVWKEIVV